MSWPDNVTKKDLRIEYFRGSGKGGQNRNKRDTACRITHIETGLFATAEDQKSQLRNKKAAFRRLAQKLIPLMRDAVKGTQIRGSTETIRTYHQPRNQVKDYRVKDRTWLYKDVLDGNALDEIMEEVRYEQATK